MYLSPPDAPNGSVSPERHDDNSYAVTAEFYDILQADRDAARVLRLYGREVRSARVGVLDIGAGTGRVTVMSLAQSHVPVHAVEPSRAMRSPLMTRLSALPTAVRSRATVHAEPLERAELRGVADVALCHNTVACLDPAARRTLWPAVAEALVPGGVLLFQLPPPRLAREASTHTLPTRRLGRHTYGGHLVTSPDEHRIRARFHYWVRGGEGVFRRHEETFWMWPTSRDRLTEELRDHGLLLRPGPTDPSVMAVRLQPG